MRPHHSPGMDVLIRNEFLWVHIIQEPLEALTVQSLSELHTLRYVPVILALNKTLNTFHFNIHLSSCIIWFI